MSSEHGSKRRHKPIQPPSPISAEEEQRRKESVFRRLGNPQPREIRVPPTKHAERPTSGVSETSPLKYCRHWMSYGKCSYGNACTFYHPPLSASQSPKKHAHRVPSKRSDELLTPSPSNEDSSGRIRSAVVVSTVSSSEGSSSRKPSRKVTIPPDERSNSSRAANYEFESALELEKKRQDLQRRLNALGSDAPPPSDVEISYVNRLPRRRSPPSSFDIRGSFGDAKGVDDPTLASGELSKSYNRDYRRFAIESNRSLKKPGSPSRQRYDYTFPGQMRERRRYDMEEGELSDDPEKREARREKLALAKLEASNKVEKQPRSPRTPPPPPSMVVEKSSSIEQRGKSRMSDKEVLRSSTRQRIVNVEEEDFNLQREKEKFDLLQQQEQRKSRQRRARTPPPNERKAGDERKMRGVDIKLFPPSPERKEQRSMEKARDYSMSPPKKYSSIVVDDRRSSKMGEIGKDGGGVKIRGGKAGLKEKREEKEYLFKEPEREKRMLRQTEYSPRDVYAYGKGKGEKRKFVDYSDVQRRDMKSYGAAYGMEERESLERSSRGEMSKRKAEEVDLLRDRRSYSGDERARAMFVAKDQQQSMDRRNYERSPIERRGVKRVHSQISRDGAEMRRKADSQRRHDYMARTPPPPPPIPTRVDASSRRRGQLRKVVRSQHFAQSSSHLRAEASIRHAKRENQQQIRKKYEQFAANRRAALNRPGLVVGRRSARSTYKQARERERAGVNFRRGEKDLYGRRSTSPVALPMAPLSGRAQRWTSASRMNVKRTGGNLTPLRPRGEQRDRVEERRRSDVLDVGVLAEPVDGQEGSSVVREDRREKRGHSSGEARQAKIPKKASSIEAKISRISGRIKAKGTDYKDELRRRPSSRQTSSKSETVQKSDKSKSPSTAKLENSSSNAEFSPKEETPKSESVDDANLVGNEEFEPISDEEVQEEAGNVVGAGDLTRVDWSCLVAESKKSANDTTTSRTASSMDRFKPEVLLVNLGLQKSLLTPALVEKIEAVVNANRQNEEPQFHLSDSNENRPSLHSAQRRLKILNDIGPFRKALCARSDLHIRRRLCGLYPETFENVHTTEINVPFNSEAYAAARELFLKKRNVKKEIVPPQVV